MHKQRFNRGHGMGQFKDCLSELEESKDLLEKVTIQQACRLLDIKYCMITYLIRIGKLEVDSERKVYVKSILKYKKNLYKRKTPFKDYVTVPEFAKLKKVKTQAIYYLVRNGFLEIKKKKQRIYIYKDCIIPLDLVKRTKIKNTSSTSYEPEGEASSLSCRSHRS